MSRRAKTILTAFIFLAPNLLGFLCFTLVPVVISFAGSFTTWSLKPAVPLKAVGFENYLYLLQDPNFYFYFYNTVYLMLSLPFSIAGALFLAILLHGQHGFRRTGRNRRFSILTGVVFFFAVIAFAIAGNRDLAFLCGALGIIASAGFYYESITYRTVFYLPHFTAGAATIILWSQLFNPNFGLINQLVQGAGNALGVSVDPPGWLSSTKSLLGFLPLPKHFSNGGFGLGAREAIMIMGIWAAIGGNNMLLYLAGLSNISPDLYEAADIDGANGWQRFLHITLPQLAPTTFFIVVMSFIGGLQGGFEQARLMTEGGPAGTTTTLSYYIYIQGFERLDLGYGSAVAWILFVVIFIITLIYWRHGKQGVAD